ncbi:MAG: NAD(P)H-hydrate epimerase, partial [Lachnospiraceae bacterium]|nr:NAD(P)H-hydrate epimerase [Lachnospiraceae bacterium]
MNYAADSKTMKEIDSFSINYGMPSLVLMERAAYSVCEEIIKNESKKSSILVICGYGNNGGDGIAIARILREFGYYADILMVGNSQKRTEDNEKQEKIAKKLVNYVNKSKIFEYNIIVDAIFGIG